MGSRCFAFLASVILVWPTSAAAGEISAEDLLGKYEQSLAMFQRATFRVRIQRYSDWPGFAPKDGPYRDDSYQVWQDGKRWKQREFSIDRQLERGKVRVVKRGDETLQLDKGSLSVGLDAEGRPEGILASLEEPSDVRRRRLPFNEQYSPVINGGMGFNPSSLPEILRQSQLSSRQVMENGLKLWVLEGTTSWGYYGFWLDPQQGFLPRRIIGRKQGKDKIYWGRDRTTTVDTVPSENYGPWKRVSQQLETTHFGIANGRPVITGFTFTEEVQMAEGVRSPDTSHSRFIVSFSDINLHPDFSQDPFTITTAIPNGFHVTVDEQRGIDYEWQDGNIVKSVNQASVENLEGNRFQGGSPIGWGLFFLALLAAGGCVVLIWNRRRIAKGTS